MSVRLRAAEMFLPRRLRRRRFERLIALFARTLRAETPALSRISFDETLTVFARFTAEQAARFPPGNPASTEAKRRLRDAAFGFGQDLRRDLGIRSADDVMRAGRLLYRILGIDFHGTASGKIIIRKCFFAAHYSPQTCAFISALDEGVLAGLAGGGRLEFSERITEDRPCCLARFELPAEIR